MNCRLYLNDSKASLHSLSKQSPPHFEISQVCSKLIHGPRADSPSCQQLRRSTRRLCCWNQGCPEGYHALPVRLFQSYSEHPYSCKGIARESASSQLEA